MNTPDPPGWREPRQPNLGDEITEGIHTAREAWHAEETTAPESVAFEPPTLPLYSRAHGAAILAAVHDIHAREFDQRDAWAAKPHPKRWALVIGVLALAVLAALMAGDWRPTWLAWGLLAALIVTVAWLVEACVRWYLRITRARDNLADAQRHMRSL